MSYPRDNLGDYGRVIDDLHEAKGNADTLYSQIGRIAVLKAAPYLLAAGGAVGVGLLKLGQKISYLWKERKQAIKDEPTLKKGFVETIENMPPESTTEDTSDDSSST